MESYATNVVARYLEVGGLSADKLRKAETPFLDEAKDPSGVEEQPVSAKPPKPSSTGSTGDDTAACPTCGAAKKNKQKVKAGAGFVGVEGELNRPAASIGMASLYASRLCRADILRAITRLAEQFHKWTPLSTRKLHRLMEYYNHTKSYKQYAFIGDDWSELEVAVFVDADWASDRSDYKSTTGGLLVLLGANTFFPLAFMSQKQGCVSVSTPEAEVVALMQMIKNLGIPSLDFLDIVFGRPTHIKVYEDNEATQKFSGMENSRRRSVTSTARTASHCRG